MSFGEVEEKDKNPYGNADRGDNSKADWAKDAEQRMGKPVAIGDETKTSGMIRTEAEKAISDLEARFPEVAKRLNLNGIDLNDPMAALVARDQAVSLTREAEGQQLQQAVGTGVAALVGGAVALGALSGATSQDQTLTTAALGGAAAGDNSKTIDPVLLAALENDTFQKLGDRGMLSAGQVLFKNSDIPKSLSDAATMNLAVIEGLPMPKDKEISQSASMLRA